MKSFPSHYAADDFVFFLHIPKTAGTSVTNSLIAAFPQDKTLTPHQMNNVRQYSSDIFLNAELLCGHFTHDVYGKRLPKQPDFIFTFLRDPVEHYISTFYHLKMDPDFAYTIRLTDEKSLANKIHADLKQLDVEEFFKYQHSGMFDNFQTRYLVRGLSSDYEGLSDPELLPAAKELLLSLPFFGVTERFNESLELLGSVMKRSRGLKFHRANAARNRPRNLALSPELMAEIKHRTKIDGMLYELASLEFSRRLLASRSDRQDTEGDSYLDL